MARVTIPLNELLSDPSYPQLKTHVIDSTGLAYYRDRDDVLADRIARRLCELRVKKCSDYLHLLEDQESGQAEMDQLVTELTIGETYFFRDSTQFELLRDEILPSILRRNREIRRIRIWSAGCATGAEPYSVAILLRREMARLVSGWDITILGTDINRRFLAQAWKAEFPEWHLRGTPEYIKESCFRSLGKTWALRPEFKEGVSFQYYNLVKHRAPSLLNSLAGFDLIICRNVMIYFSHDIIRTLVGHLFDSLVEGGWLIVGQAELNNQIFSIFQPVHVKGTTAYQKVSKARAPRERGKTGSPQRTPLPFFDFALPDLPPTAERPNHQAQRSVVSVPRPQRSVRSSEGSSPPRRCSEDGSALEEIRSLANRGEYEAASQRCRELLEDQNLSPLLHFYQGLVLDQMGEYQEAESSLRRAIYLDRSFILAHYHLGILFQRRGQVREAMRSFKNVLQVLSQGSREEPLPEIEDLTCAELSELTQMQLNVLEAL